MNSKSIFNNYYLFLKDNNIPASHQANPQHLSFIMQKVSLINLSNQSILKRLRKSVRPRYEK